MNKKLADCDWDYLSGLETVAEPKQPMARLADLLTYLARPGNEHVWVVLDIKRDDDADELLAATAATLGSATPSPTGKPWEDRVVLGAWTERYVGLCRKHLPGYGVVLINWSVSEAWRVLRRGSEGEDVGFSLLQPALVGPRGSRFIRAARAAGRVLFVWTVNRERWMHWSIRKGVDGVITDDPKKFLEVCERWRAGGGQRTTTAGQFLCEALVQVLVLLLTPWVWYVVWRANRKRAVPVKG